MLSEQKKQFQTTHLGLCDARPASSRSEFAEILPILTELKSEKLFHFLVH